jgi:hypothetical protein
MKALEIAAGTVSVLVGVGIALGAVWSGRQLLMSAAAVLVLALLVHGGFALVSMVHPALGSWRHLLIGVASSLVGCFGFAAGAGFGEPVR